MAQAIFTIPRFRVLFAVWWGHWIGLHTLVLTQAGYPVQTALADSFISNVLLAGTTLLATISLYHYVPQKNRYGYLLSLCAALSLIWLFVSRSLLFVVIDGGEEYNHFFSQTFVLRGVIGFLLTICIALMAVLWYTLQEQQETERRNNEAQQLSKEAELNSLRQQLQPHFLFNSLNSINALIGMQPQKARTMIQQLSDFLRGTLKKDQKDWISLEEELQHLELYLEIEKVRFGHRLQTTVSNEAPGALLPLMLLQPVVENAIKFGLYDTTEAVTISIRAIVEGGVLFLTVQNPYDPQTSEPQKGTGFGLSSVKRRLYLLFARNDLLQTATHDHTFIATIKIPQP